MNAWDEQENRRNVISAAILDALAHVEDKLADSGYSIVSTTVVQALDAHRAVMLNLDGDT